MYVYDAHCPFCVTSSRGAKSRREILPGAVSNADERRSASHGCSDGRACRNIHEGTGQLERRPDVAAPVQQVKADVERLAIVAQSESARGAGTLAGRLWLKLYGCRA